MIALQRRLMICDAYTGVDGFNCTGSMIYQVNSTPSLPNNLYKDHFAHKCNYCGRAEYYTERYPHPVLS